MHPITRALALGALIACSGCGNANISEARRDHILAVDHGWVDVTFEALPTTTSTANAAKETLCSIGVAANGEPLLQEQGDVAMAAQNHNALGYRFPAPAGKLQFETSLSGCTAAFSAKQEIELGKDELLSLAFDGKQWVEKGKSAYVPTNLDWVRAQMERLQNNQQAEGEHLGTLTWIILASSLLNVGLLALVLKRRSA